MNILIIGGGNMGLTYAKSFLRSHIASEKNMMILEKSPEKAIELAKAGAWKVHGLAQECLPSADLVILAVKPQDAPALFEQIRPMVEAQQVFLSIMAGIKISAIEAGLGVQKIVRAMPNLPAQIGLGMTAFTSSEAVTRIELIMIQNLLATTGKTVYLEQEVHIDAATAISGSGPAYVWFFMDAMIQAARSMGFSQSEAELLVGQTFRGAVDLFQQLDFSCAEWIQKVCSKGGTTEAAMASFEQSALQQHIMDGAQKALDRAVELGQ